MRVELAVVTGLLLTACATVKQTARGRCTEYEPVLGCWEGRQVCETDAAGCRSCSCVQSTAPVVLPPRP